MKVNWSLVLTIVVALGIFSLCLVLGRIIALFIIWKTLVG